MRILNRVIVAGALVVPMALGASGVAAADGSDECGGEYPCETTDICDVEGDGFLEGLLNELLGIGEDADDDECGGDGTKFTD